MSTLKYTVLAAVLLGAACQSGDDSAKPKSPGSSASAADITLRATSDIRTPAPIKAATFVPNSVASWLGHIILLDDKGKLHRATTDSLETEVVALGRYADVIGLARDKKSGVFLALTPQGQIKAFVESDNEGNFSPLAVSQNLQVFERFCASAKPSGAFIWAETEAGQSEKIAVDVFEDSSVTLSESKIAKDDIDICKANDALKLGAGYSIGPDDKGAGLILDDDKNRMTMDVMNGLSIQGVKDAGFVTVTSSNMGSVFNQGAILIAEQDEGRLVLIARGYALKELEAR